MQSVGASVGEELLRRSYLLAYVNLSMAISRNCEIKLHQQPMALPRGEPGTGLARTAWRLRGEMMSACGTKPPLASQITTIRRSV